MSARKRIFGADKICKDIVDALGIKHCRWLQINMHVDEIMTVKAEFYPEIDGVAQLDTIFKEYELIEKKCKDANRFEQPSESQFER